MIRTFLAALLLLGVLTSCSGDESPDSDSGSEPTSTAADGPRPAKPARVPELGACYRMSYEAALAPTSTHRVANCKGPHTAETYFVGQLDLVVHGHLLAVDSDRAYAQVNRTCQRKFAAYVGGSPEARRLSMLVGFGFSPTVKQSDAGQSWFRCDVVASSSPGKLARLSGELEGILDTADGRARYGRCATAKPGTEGSEQVICARDDAWRAVATANVEPAKGDSWPGLKAAKRAGQACEDKVRVLAASPFNFEWGYEWPTEEQWSAGQHYGFCWAPRGN